MTENTHKEEDQTFPFPKVLQTINYFFPKEKGAPEIFTIDNLRKISRYAPFLAFGILILIFASVIRDAILGDDKNWKYLLYYMVDAMGFLGGFFGFLYWMGLAMLAKLARRSAMVPLAMSGIYLLQLLAFLCLAHFIIFIIAAIGSLGNGTV